MKKCIVTLVVGDKYLNQWKRYFEPSWRQYAGKWGYDLVCLEERLDTSERAAKRSVAWQKCLVLSQTFSAQYDRMVWIDSDIHIDPNAPDLPAVPETHVGGTDAYSLFTSGLYDHLYSQYITYWAKHGIKAIECPTPSSFYTAYGLPGDCHAAIQTGVLSLSPKYHREILENAYYNHEEKGGAEWNYEMRPLSYEIVKTGNYHFIDQRFNLLLADYIALFYPHLMEVSGLKRIFNKHIGPYLGKNSPRYTALHSAEKIAYFLHFAGGLTDYKYLTAQPGK
jgi:hypothetical protein